MKRRAARRARWYAGGGELMCSTLAASERAWRGADRRRNQSSAAWGEWRVKDARVAQEAEREALR
jgi:hypothetical protein